jgi:hypothetical protein
MGITKGYTCSIYTERPLEPVTMAYCKRMARWPCCGGIVCIAFDLAIGNDTKHGHTAFDLRGMEGVGRIN